MLLSRPRGKIDSLPEHQTRGPSALESFLLPAETFVSVLIPKQSGQLTSQAVLGII